MWTTFHTLLWFLDHEGITSLAAAVISDLIPFSGYNKNLILTDSFGPYYIHVDECV